MGLSTGSGSTANTSSAAPFIRPLLSASIIAGSFTTPPRATFTTTMPGFIAAISGASIMSRVSSVSGHEMMSASTSGNTSRSAF